ncbi:HK97 family phage prohead protease [Candidatus Mycolicibacterium alkanivorans]|uniref:HK97 family phage prohead protease n=1 Tax=Candidatus Mycolicibacterium alkanivorans TaxID=2954114 RepID=A0ABS9YU85_9MYCO|nr:HK97 family phage prohead protease [Candidatus Mycolicibacterium alkanivorans]MCI4674780.1 HK97 family phage prohead protease [Candidatus Mycolicibacterium alkanivorans]
MNTDTPTTWIDRLPDWIIDHEIRWLTRHPWIAGFIQPGDYSIDPAVARFENSQRRFTRRNPPNELLEVRGYETTSLRSGNATTDIRRTVHVHTTEAQHLEGLAVPYGQPSTPVEIGGLLGVEQFDRHSITLMPTTVPLHVDHDPDHTIGRATPRHTTTGLRIDATITTTDKQTWLQRWIRGEYSSLSIAFKAAPLHDDWSTYDGLPLRIVRGAELVETSVVRAGAYTQARIETVT